MTIQDFAIIVYCLFQVAGCFFVGRAIFRMTIARREELKRKPVSVRKASND